MFSFLVPTRGRPDRVARLFQSIVETTSRPNDLEVVLAVDEDDTPSHNISHPELRVTRTIVPPGLTMGALNQACYRASSGRYVMLLNDDVVLRTRGWDDTIAAAFASYPDDIALIHVNDLLFQKRLCTFPFLSRTACDLIGLCPEGYRRYKIDDHIYETYCMLAHIGHRRIVYLPDVVFAHENHTAAPGADASPNHIFVAGENKMYVPHGPTIEQDDALLRVTLPDRRRAVLALSDHIIRRHTDLQTRSFHSVHENKLNGIKEPYSFRRPGYVTVQPGSSARLGPLPAYSTDTHRTTIAVVTSDVRKDIAWRCIDAIKSHTKNVDLIIMDNGGGRDFNHAAEMNRALQMVTTDFLVLIDDDVFVDDGWLDGLLRCVDDRTVVVAPMHSGNVPFSGAYLMGNGRGTHAHTTDTPDAPREMQCYSSAVILLDVRKIGHILMEEKYSKYFFDLVHGLTVWEAGFRAVCTPHVIVTHIGGGTLTSRSAEAGELVQRDRAIFVEDWVESGRLAKLEAGIWQAYPYTKSLVDIPRAINAFRGEVDRESAKGIEARLRELESRAAGFGQFDTFLGIVFGQAVAELIAAGHDDKADTCLRLMDGFPEERSVTAYRNGIKALIERNRADDAERLTAKARRRHPNREDLALPIGFPRSKS